MSLRNELGYKKPFKHRVEETLLSIIHTGTLLSKEGDRLLRPFGLTDAQFNVLVLLKYHSVDGRINQTSLGKMLLVNRSNITGLVDRMEKAGLVRRISDPQDRRVNYVTMTDAGGRVLEKAHQAYLSRIEEVMSNLSAQDQETLSGILEKVRGQL
ncbi:MAG: MarR family transcriptional regulator [Gemmatimonadota bacterium]|nr:MarR family transcriptional regulator [Gemmatimonadota bacterium]